MDPGFVSEAPERSNFKLSSVIVNAIKKSKLSKLQKRALIIALAAAGALNVVTAGDAAYDSIVRAVKDTKCECFFVKYGKFEEKQIKFNCKGKRLSYVFRALGHATIAAQLASEVADIVANEIYVDAFDN